MENDMAGGMIQWLSIVFHVALSYFPIFEADIYYYLKKGGGAYLKEGGYFSDFRIFKRERVYLGRGFIWKGGIFDKIRYSNKRPHKEKGDAYWRGAPIF